ncbi:MAG: IPExxxVDY family protein [Flavobacteriaceae bacterium]
MAIHKLVLNDFEDTDYTLFAIHSDLECFRVAQIINRILNTRLQRTKQDLELNITEQLNFPVFEWNDLSLRSTWNLVQNSCNVEITSAGQGLFSQTTEQNITRHPLLGEYADVDFFLKISGECSSKDNISKLLNQVPSIHLVYPIEVEALKSKDYLILN